jgi:cell division protease FtsH
VGRTEILKVHIKGKPLAKSVNLESLAKQTAGFSGADLANLVNEAAITAARLGKKEIGIDELEDSIDKVIAGPERKSRRISPKEKEITAYHEAGHALVAKMMPEADPVHKISIVARGMSLGQTRQLPIEDHYLTTRTQIEAVLATLMGGRTAEQIIFNEVTTGAYDDIKRATALARRMVTDFGMSEKLGPRTFGDKQELVFLGREISEQRDYGDKLADAIDDEVNRFIEEAHETATRIITEKKARLKQVAERLIVQETIEGEELEKLLSEDVPFTPAPAAVGPASKAEKAITRDEVKPIQKPAPSVPPGFPEGAPAPAQ